MTIERIRSWTLLGNFNKKVLKEIDISRSKNTKKAKGKKQ